MLTIPRGGLLTISVLAAAYFASNGVEALRISLNRAYRVPETRPWYFTRLASLGYRADRGADLCGDQHPAAVAVPLALDYAGPWLPWLADTLDVVASWRIYGTLFVLTVGLLVVHLWLPAGGARCSDVVPGVLLTLIAWLAGA